MNETVNISEGDKVLATNTNGDTATFIVRGKPHNGLRSDTNVYVEDDGWSFTVIERAKAPLPTTAGIYQLDPTKYGGRNLLLTKHGLWFWIDFTVSESAPPGYQGAPVKNIEGYRGSLTLKWAYSK